MHTRAWILVGVLLTVQCLGQFTLTTSDRMVAHGTPAGISDGRLSWNAAAGPARIPLDQIVSLEGSGADAPPPPGSLRLETRSGDRIIGTCTGGTADDVRLRSSAYGEATFSLDDLVAIWNVDFVKGGAEPPAIKTEKETLYVDRQGWIDSIPGTLERIGANDVVFSSAAGDNRRFDFGRDRIVGLRLPRTGAPKAAAGTTATVALRDSGRITGVIRGGDAARVKLKMTLGQEIGLDWAAVKTITFAGDGFRYLSDLEPASIEETPLLPGSARHGMRRDGGLMPGDPLRIGRQTFMKGLLLFAKTKVTYAVPPAMTRFSARVGVDPATTARELPGSVRISVLVDGKPRFASEVLRAGQDPVLVDLDGLQGAKELAIVADFGDSFDAGARAVVGGAMVLK